MTASPPTDADPATPWLRWVRRTPAASATVILVAGLAGMTEDWAEVVRQLPCSLAALAIEPTRCPLSALLADRVEMLAAGCAEVDGPLIWVAHSMAAFAVEAALLSGAVRCDAVVLVDPSVPEEAPSRRRGLRPSGSDGDLPWAGTAIARFLDRHPERVAGIAGVLGPLGRRLSVRLLARRADPRGAEAVRSMYGDPVVLATALQELDAFGSQVRDLQALRAQVPRPQVPWVTLLADRRRYGYSEAAGEVVRMVPGTGHLLMIERPDAVVAAIGQVQPRSS